MPAKTTNISDATAISAGRDHTCVLRRDSSIYCWGNNNYGQLGNGEQGDGWEDDSAYSVIPVQVKNISDATAISAGLVHTCALIKDGTIRCWGNNEIGKLGTGTNSSSSVPVRVTDITDATAISAGSQHTCALIKDSTIKCWGGNWFGQLGNSTEDDSTSVPVRVTDITDADITNAAAISAGRDHTCALIKDSTIKCWGGNWFGQLGNSADRLGNNNPSATVNNPSATPVKVTDITDATAISAGDDHTCALIKDSTIKCWGVNFSGQVGTGTYPHTFTPVKVTDITDATAIITGNNHTCTLKREGSIYCWGNNDNGQLGTGIISGSSVPVKVPNITDATAITSWDNTCALIKDSTIKCWARLGSNSEGSSISVPVKVTDATAISKGYKHTCALKRDGSIYCWGRNNFVQLGNGEQGYGLGDDSADSVIPVQVKNISDATAITAGKDHTCALKRDGSIYCWGNNYNGQLGSNTEGINSSVPVRVTDITDATAITTSWDNTCALIKDGTISCWGDNRNGQLGDGYILGTPEKVKGIGG